MRPTIGSTGLAALAGEPYVGRMGPEDAASPMREGRQG